MPHKLLLSVYLEVLVVLFFLITSFLTAVNYEEFFKNIIEDKERCY